MFALRNKIRLQNGVECQSIDDLTWSLGEDNSGPGCGLSVAIPHTQMNCLPSKE
jgi:hypothetical protein